MLVQEVRHVVDLPARDIRQPSPGDVDSPQTRLQASARRPGGGSTRSLSMARWSKAQHLAMDGHPAVLFRVVLPHLFILDLNHVDDPRVEVP